MHKKAGAIMDVHTFLNDDTQMDMYFLLFNCTYLTLTLVLGLPGNLWVCWVVFRTKSLQTCSNALLVSLAASDLLKCSVDTPLLLFSLLCRESESQLSEFVFALQQFTYALFSCVQLLTLLSISVERFKAIAFPFQTKRRKARVCFWIMSIWALSLILAIITLTFSPKGLYVIVRNDGDDCCQYSDPLVPYVLVPVWGLSLTVIVVHHVQIFRVVRQHRRKVFNQGVQLRPTVSKNLGVPASATQMAPQGHFKTLSPGGPGSPLHPCRTILHVAEASTPCAGMSTGDTPRKHPEILGKVCLLTPGARELGKKQMEGKLAQRFGYIIIAFTLLWVPMVVIWLMNVIYWQRMDRLQMELETSAMVLTCMQAAVDPLIYTLVTRQFRSEFHKILSSITRCPLKLRI